jgi:hypothetical protein
MPSTGRRPHHQHWEVSAQYASSPEPQQNLLLAQTSGPQQISSSRMQRLALAQNVVPL